MIEWSETHLAFRDALRRFVAAEVAPHLEELEHGSTPPYAMLRKLFMTFGIDELARMRFDHEVARAKAAEAALTPPGEAERGGTAKQGDTAEQAPAPKTEAALEEARAARADEAALRALLTIELSRYCPGAVTAMGVSVGLTASTIMSRGTLRQKERWARELLTLEKVGAWAITEPGSGSDAFGSMRASARRDADGYVLAGNKTFITNGPYADTTVFVCKLDDGHDPKDRQVLSFVLDRGMPGFTQSRPLRKMGMHSSPTGEIFVDDVRVGRDRLLGEDETRSYRSGVKDTFGAERTGVAAMALGIVEQCLTLCTHYARTREQFGKRIGDFQLIQLKLAKMEVARMNLQNLLFRQLELTRHGKSIGFAEASASKLYSAQTAMEVALEAVQLFGGNGYMAEYQVEQLCRDAKVLQIYGGTDEIQTSQIARSLLDG